MGFGNKTVEGVGGLQVRGHGWFYGRSSWFGFKGARKHVTVQGSVLIHDNEHQNWITEHRGSRCMMGKSLRRSSSWPQLPFRKGLRSAEWSLRCLNKRLQDLQDKWVWITENLLWSHDFLGKAAEILKSGSKPWRVRTVDSKGKAKMENLLFDLLWGKYPVSVASLMDSL